MNDSPKFRLFYLHETKWWQLPATGIEGLHDAVRLAYESSLAPRTVGIVAADRCHYNEASQEWVLEDKMPIFMFIGGWYYSRNQKPGTQDIAKSLYFWEATRQK